MVVAAVAWQVDGDCRHIPGGRLCLNDAFCRQWEPNRHVKGRARFPIARRGDHGAISVYFA